MTTMSGLEGLLEEAFEDGNNITKEISTEVDLIECDGYTCGECGKNEILKDEMKMHLNQSHGHDISLKNTPSVTDIKSGEEALRKKVELYEEAIQNLKYTKQKIIEEKQAMKEDKDKPIRTLENDRDKLYRLNERAKDSFYRLQGLNVNRIHTVIENTKLKEEATSLEELLQQTLGANQIIREENDLLKKTIQLLEKEKDRLEEHIQPSDEEEEEPPVTKSALEIKCTKCEFPTNNETHMIGHQVKHAAHVCNNCSKQFHTKEALNQHVSDKHIIAHPVGHPVWATEKNLIETMKCRECAQIFDSKLNLESHIKNIHSDYSCIQCGEVFTTKKDINSHKKNDHNNQFEGLGLEQIKFLPKITCQCCDYETNTLDSGFESKHKFRKTFILRMT